MSISREEAMKFFVGISIFRETTLPETTMAPQDGPSGKETSPYYHSVGAILVLQSIFVDGWG